MAEQRRKENERHVRAIERIENAERRERKACKHPEKFWVTKSFGCDGDEDFDVSCTKCGGHVGSCKPCNWDDMVKRLRSEGKGG